MGLSAWMFAAFYDFLNSVVEERVKPYRLETAGKAWGDVIEIGGGTGANLAYYNRNVRLTISEPNPHMVRRYLSMRKLWELVPKWFQTPERTCLLMMTVSIALLQP